MQFNKLNNHDVKLIIIRTSQCSGAVKILFRKGRGKDEFMGGGGMEMGIIPKLLY